MTKKRVALAGLMALVAMSASPAGSLARVVDCPVNIRVKADNPPAPWKSPEYNNFTLLNFDHASMSCAAGTCSISCAYTMYASCGQGATVNSFTFLVDHVQPGECQYSRNRRGFDCK
ncbi:MAG TPA: hypothetical protein VJN94_17870 [Candidatus Binataceae bacterium]|nr:hypothetical protein [Candidatus Binataceae bacterium]